MASPMLKQYGNKWATATTVFDHGKLSLQY